MLNALIFDELAKFTLLKRALPYDMNLASTQSIFIDQLNLIEDVDKKSLTRFLSKIKFTENIEDCWEWQAYCDYFGYGTFWVSEAKTMMKTHRLFYYLINNLIINEDVLHKCDNPSCCNPFHVYEGNDENNVKDKYNRNRAVNLKNEEHGRCYISNELARKICEEIDTINNISEKYNIPRSTIQNIRSKRIRGDVTSDIEVVDPIPKYQKMDYNKAEQMRADYKTKTYTRKQLETKYGVGNYTVQEILSNKRFPKIVKEG